MTNENNSSPPASNVIPKLTSEKIWDEIKDKDIEMYALPAKKLQDLCTYAFVEPSKCYVIGSNPALIAALETHLAPKFAVERSDNFIVISKR